MDTLTAAILALNARPENNGNFAGRYVREMPTPADYALAMYLPEETRESYSVDTGAFAIYPTMAGLSGMDSNYAPVGAVAASRFLEESAKITGQLVLPEKHLRELQALTMRLQAAGTDALPAAAETVTDFVGVLMQAHWDTAEWLRGQALFTGEINWQFGGTEVVVDYQIPDANKFDTRTAAAAYDKAESTFWLDVRAARKILGQSAQFVMNRATFYGITDNPVNSVALESLGSEVSSTGLVERYRLTKRVGTAAVPSNDVRDSVEVTVYDRGGSVISTADPSKTEPKQFVPDGRIAALGTAERPAFRVGRGAQPDLVNPGRVGYYHVAPTTEGAGTPGRWARVYQPESAPMQVHSQSAGNELPVIESPDKVVILSSEIGA